MERKRGDHRIFSLDRWFGDTAFRHGVAGEGGEREEGKFPYMRSERWFLYHNDNETPMRVRASLSQEGNCGAAAYPLISIRRISRNIFTGSKVTIANAASIGTLEELGLFHQSPPPRVLHAFFAVSL